MEGALIFREAFRAMGVRAHTPIAPKWEQSVPAELDRIYSQFKAANEEEYQTGFTAMKMVARV